jgi:hypothetical protein
VEADLLAKSMIPIAKVQPRHLKIPLEPWSVWQGHNKIKHFSKDIYNIAHAPQAKEHWKQKGKASEETIKVVNWGAIGEALKGMPRARQHFITKQTVEICGVGKWMKQ